MKSPGKQPSSKANEHLPPYDKNRLHWESAQFIIVSEIKF